MQYLLIMLLFFPDKSLMEFNASTFFSLMHRIVCTFSEFILEFKTKTGEKSYVESVGFHFKFTYAYAYV